MDGAVWISLYFFANLALTIHNKWILSRIHFSFPWLLTALHIGVSGVGALIALTVVYGKRPARLNRRQHLQLLLFSVLYAVNIAVSNVSLRHVSLAFHQIVRSSTPAFTVLLEMLFQQKYPKPMTLLALVPVMLGVCLATADEFGRRDFTTDGFWLTVLGVVLSAAKGIVTNQLLVGDLNLHPLDLLWKMGPSSVAQCLVYALIFGETSGLAQRQSLSASDNMSLLANGLLAFALNWVSFTANQRTSALSMTVAGNVKQALSIALAVWIFATPVTAINVVGIVMTVVGGAWYSGLQLQVKMERGVNKGKADGYQSIPTVERQ